MTELKKTTNLKHPALFSTSQSMEATASPLPPLTEKERKVFEFIEGYWQRLGLSPSFQEIKEQFGFASFNSVQNYIKQLSQKNYIQVFPNQKRGIKVLSPAAGTSFNENELKLPLLGDVAAGVPLEAHHHEEFVDVPRGFVKQPHNSYALRVKGSSMIDEGIFSQDILIVQKQDVASQGEMIVAVIDNEATVKRWYSGTHTANKNLIELRPSNSQMRSLWYEPHQVQIRGKAIALLRKF